MTRRLILAAVITATLAGCRYVPPPFVQHSPPRAYCTNEPTVRHGHAVYHITGGRLMQAVILLAALALLGALLAIAAIDGMDDDL